MAPGRRAAARDGRARRRTRRRDPSRRSSIRGGALHGVRHELPVASAQVKSALVLAGLQADGVTEIVSPAPSRDHTERMLAALGVPVAVDGLAVRVRAGRAASRSSSRCRAIRRRPRSSWSRRAITPGSDLVIEGVSCNPTRARLRRRVATHGRRHRGRRRPARCCGEPVGELRVRAVGAARHDDRGRRDPERAGRDPGARGRGRVRRRRHRGARRGGARGEGEQPHRHAAPGAVASSGSAVETRADGLVDPRRRAEARDLRSRATATTASRWRRRSPPTRSTARRTVRGWQAVSSSYPEFADDLARLTGAR